MSSVEFFKRVKKKNLMQYQGKRAHKATEQLCAGNVVLNFQSFSSPSTHLCQSQAQVLLSYVTMIGLDRPVSQKVKLTVWNHFGA